jgi:staphylococcal nuclease domain-containing protein 1
VVRVWGSDQLSVVAKGDDQGRERRVQLASVRGPRYVLMIFYQHCSQPGLTIRLVEARKPSKLIGPTKRRSRRPSYWLSVSIWWVRRFLRKRLIGKTVHVLIDYVKPREGEYEERECVTVTYGAQNT